MLYILVPSGVRCSLAQLLNFYFTIFTEGVVNEFVCVIHRSRCP